MSSDAPLPLEHQPDPGPTSSRVISEPGFARHERSRAPGWIWSVPIAAFAIVAWLGFRQITSTGPSINVIFPEAGGISTGTAVQYQGMNVGSVESVRFEKDLKHVRAAIRMDPSMDGHLGEGTAFWIAGPSLTDLASIKSIIAGPSIGILPQSGRTQRDYVALSEPPLSEGVVPGRHFRLHASKTGNLKRGTVIYFRNFDVGYVETVHFQPDRTFEFSIFIKSPFDNLVSADTRFWNSGPVQLAMTPTGPQLQFQSVAALLTGAIAFDASPGSERAPEAAPGHLFALYGSKDEADYAPGRHSVLYRVVFAAEAGALADGAPVMLAGKQIGAVQHSALEYDPKRGALAQHVTIAVEPTRIALTDGNWPEDSGPAVSAMIEQLVGKGLRAQLGSTLPLVGPQDVELVFVPGAPVATLAGNPPELPTAPGGAGLQGVMASLNAIAAKIDSLPLDQIGAELHTATARLAALSSSPDLTRSLSGLDRALTNLDQITASAKAELPAILLQLRQVAREANGAVTDTRQLLASAMGQGPVTLNNAGISQTLYELTRAARAIRQLADYLDRNPSALVRGRE